MSIDNWLAISAGATFLLALAAFWAIWQNYSLRQKERKERLLNEIIEWAIDVTNWRSESKKVFKEMVGITDIKQQEVFTHAHIVEVKEGFVGMSGRNQYISSISREFKQDLQEVAIKLIEDLEAYIELLDEWQQVKADAIAQDLIKAEEYITKDGEYTTKADEYALQLDKSASRVIDEAAKIKTRDIS